MFDELSKEKLSGKDLKEYIDNVLRDTHADIVNLESKLEYAKFKYKSFLKLRKLTKSVKNSDVL